MINTILKLRKNTFFVLSSIIFSLINLRNIFYGNPIFDDYDSPAYFTFTLYPSARMQIMTIIYSTLVNETLIVIFQVVVSVFSFIYLAQKFLSIFDSKIVGNFAVLALYTLGLSSVVVEQNYKLLSESLNNSGLVLLFGAMLGYVKNMNFRNYKVVILAILFLAGTKAVSSLSILIFFILFLVIMKFPIKNKKIFGFESL